MGKKIKHGIEKYEIKLMLQYIRKYYKRIVLLCLLSLLSMGAAYLSPLINVVIIDLGIGKSNWKILIIAVVLMLLCSVMAEILSACYTYMQQKNKFVVEKDLGNTILNYCIERGRLDKASGEIDVLLNQDMGNYASILCDIFETMFNNVASIVCIVTMLCSLNVWLAIIIIGLQVILAVLQLKQGRKIESRSIAVRSAFIEIMTVLNEITQNIRNIAGIGAKKYLMKKYGNAYDLQCDKILQQTRMSLKISSFASIYTATISCIILGCGGMLVIAHHMTVGQVVSFLQYATLFFTPVMSLLNVPFEFSSKYPSIMNVSKIIKEEITREKEKTRDGVKIEKVRVENMSFGYKSQRIIQNMDMVFESGTVNYFVGESGSGKSTLLHILSGQLKPNIGKVYYNETDISQLQIDDISEFVAWVSQDNVIFHDTILKNIVLDKEVDQQRLIQVTKDCEIYEDIMRLSNKFYEVLEEQGGNFSGGQKNRICLARALYMRKPILILDEVTAALDLETEERVKENLKKYIKNKIVFIVTHSPNFIMEEGSRYSIKNKEIKDEDMQEIA